MDSMKKLVSVIIPTYNRGKIIKKSIDSVLAQTYKYFELIIVDDGSTDNTKLIVESIDDDRIRYIYQENKGASAARNYGIQCSRGKYIAFQDSDDVWHKDKLKKQIEILQDKNADIVFCKMNRFNYGVDETFPKIAEGFVDLKTFITKPCMSTQTVFAKKEVFSSMLFDESLPALEDYAFSLKSACKYLIYHQNDVLVDVYLQDDSLTSSWDKYIEGNKLIISEYNDIWKQFPEYKAIRLYVLGCLLLDSGKDASKYFIESIKLDFKIKTCLKIIVNWFSIRMGFKRK